tara:strand:- start:1296 stop:1832 length:537 start_codon:yes stop_codon:yes gene_type:complete
MSYLKYKNYSKLLNNIIFYIIIILISIFLFIISLSFFKTNIENFELDMDGKTFKFDGSLPYRQDATILTSRSSEQIKYKNIFPYFRIVNFEDEDLCYYTKDGIFEPQGRAIFSHPEFGCSAVPVNTSKHNNEYDKKVSKKNKKKDTESTNNKKKNLHKDNKKHKSIVEKLHNGIKNSQ